jgi:hypothetical protein
MVARYLPAALQERGTGQVSIDCRPGVGWQVYYKDTESNIFGMMQAMPQPD